MLNPETASVAIHGRGVPLTRNELGLLQALMERPGHILGRAQLMRRIYPDHRVVSDRTIDSHVRNLRRKLTRSEGSSAEEDFVRSRYGIGYSVE